jgi:hypothetical protein
MQLLFQVHVLANLSYHRTSTTIRVIIQFDFDTIKIQEVSLKKSYIVIQDHGFNFSSTIYMGLFF